MTSKRVFLGLPKNDLKKIHRTFEVMILNKHLFPEGLDSPSQVVA